MLTQMSEDQWATVLALSRACRLRRGDKGRNDRKFLKRCITLPCTTSPGGRSPPSPELEVGVEGLLAVSQAACSRRSSTRWP